MKLAVDIVLLPPTEIMEHAIEINKTFVDDPIQLHFKNCLPHISLCMGVMDEVDLLKVSKELEKIGEEFVALPLRITGINSQHTAFDIERTNELQKLHEMIVERLANILTTDGTTEMCHSPPEVAEQSLLWINNYKEKFSFENFYPHITLGRSKIEAKELNIPFTASRFALCHLGTFCTCRKVLWETKLT